MKRGLIYIVIFVFLLNITLIVSYKEFYEAANPKGTEEQMNNRSINNEVRELHYSIFISDY